MGRYSIGDQVQLRGMTVYVTSWPDNDEGMFNWQGQDIRGTDHVSVIDGMPVKFQMGIAEIEVQSEASPVQVTPFVPPSTAEVPEPEVEYVPAPTPVKASARKAAPRKAAANA